MRKFLLILVLLLVAVTSVQLWVTKDRTSQKNAMEQTAAPTEASIGGDFTLTDQTGKIVHESDFHGRVALVFFGFTHCPDICPVTVAALSKTMTLLGDKADQVAPVFITVDPERDTPAVLKEYLANFDKRMIGLTGTPDQIRQVVELYKVYFAKRGIPWDPDEKSEGHEANGSDYTVDHSGYIYMMGKDGKYVTIFANNASEQEIAHAVEHYLGRGVMTLQLEVELGRRGLMFILSSPSGAGKTTLSRRLLEQYKSAAAHETIVMSVSVTTRPPRPGEKDGVDYFFVGNEKYEGMVKAGELLEYARVFEYQYGTPAKFVRDHISRGTDVLFDIDWQGTHQLSEKNRDDLVSIFILPPSMQELERRLKARAQDSDETVRKRMEKAHAEISHWQEYDYVLINQDLDQTLEKIDTILKAERLKRVRQEGLPTFVKSL